MHVVDFEFTSYNLLLVNQKKKPASIHFVNIVQES